MFYKSYGQKNLPPLLLLHGWGLSSADFEQLGKLLDRNFQVFIPDLPGFGKSSEPPVPWSISDYSKAVMSFMSAQNIRSATLIGHSFGGRIAINIARNHPERVSNLILTGSAGVEAFNFKRSIKRLVYYVCAKLFGGLTFIRPIARLKQKFYRIRDFGKLNGVMKETFLQVIAEKRDADCRTIKAPTYLIWGESDQLTPVYDADRINTLIPRSKLKIFANVGHKLPYQKPVEFAREVEAFCLRGGNESGLG